VRKTRIIATLGPVTESPDRLRALLAAGVDVVRLNMSHARHEWVQNIVPEIRQISRELGRPIGILMDTQGPAIRTGDLPSAITLDVGDTFYFVTESNDIPKGAKGTTVNYEEFAGDVHAGDILVVDNGELKMRIRSTQKGLVECEVLNAGSLGNRRHINLPGVHVSLPALTEKDREDVALGLKLGVDYIALSFVRSADDIETLRQCFKDCEHPPLIVAKIEHQFAVDHFDAIAEDADVIMIARGDLGVECPYEELPIIQRRIVKTCHHLGRPVIVATHMLESMIQSPLPTRAEITDISNAVFEQADSIMLSGETTVGRHPLACIEVMDTIARRIERSGGAGYQAEARITQPREKLVQSAVHLADHLKAHAIIVFTRTGRMARYTSWMRPRYSPIFAFCDRTELAAQLTLCRGLHPVVMPACHDDPEGSIEGALQRLKSQGRLESGQTVVVLVPPSNTLERLSDTVKMVLVP
jgi:pyruvate kinase